MSSVEGLTFNMNSPEFGHRALGRSRSHHPRSCGAAVIKTTQKRGLIRRDFVMSVSMTKSDESIGDRFNI
jgi:hypothetical protein